MVEINWKMANGLAAVTLATRSYTVLDRLANAISLDAIDKGVYELGRTLEAIIRNPKDDQAISTMKDEINVKGKWDRTPKTFKIKGKMPEERDSEFFLENAVKDVRVARHTAPYVARLVSSWKGGMKIYGFYQYCSEGSMTKKRSRWVFASMKCMVNVWKSLKRAYIKRIMEQFGYTQTEIAENFFGLSHIKFSP